MGTFKLFLRDVAGRGTRTASGITNGENACFGFGTMFAGLTSSSATMTWDAGSGNTFSIIGIGIGNHNASGGTLKLEHSANGSSWTTAIAATTIPSNDDFVAAAAAAVTNRYMRITIGSASGKSFGALGLLGGATGEMIEFVDSGPVFPIPMTMDAEVSIERTLAGGLVETRIGGSFEEVILTIPNIPFSKVDNEGLIRASFLDVSKATVGWVGPIWMVDDAGIAWHAVVIRPVQWQVEVKSTLATMQLRLRRTGRFPIA